MTTTLLAVDDSKTMRRVLEITFAGENYKIALAENADDAMGKLQAERPKVVLVDAALEGTNGYELCAKVKAAQPGAMVLILSSKHQPYDRNRGTQAGADDFMDKPFDTQQMLDKVSALVKKSASAPMAAPAPAPAPAPHQPDANARLRAQTLAYGSGSAAPSPPAPSAGAPVQRPPAPVMPAAPARPAPVAVGRQPTMIGTPLPAEVSAGTRPAPVAVPGHAAPAAPPPLPVAAPAPPPVAAPVAAAAAHALGGNGEMAQKLGALGLSREQADAVLALSREVVEKVVWEVVPTLAEALIKEEIRRLTNE